MLAALLSELICKEGGGIKGPSQPGSLAFCESANNYAYYI